MRCDNEGTPEAMAGQEPRELLAASGNNHWPSPGNYMTAPGQDLMTADTKAALGEQAKG